MDLPLLFIYDFWVFIILVGLDWIGDAMAGDFSVIYFIFDDMVD